jgi:hypothetical protein
MSTTTHPVQQKADALAAVAAKPKKLAVYGPNIGKGGEFHVFAEGDKAANAKRYAGEPPMPLTAGTAQEAIEAIYSDQLAEDAEATWEDYASTVTFHRSAGMRTPARQAATKGKPTGPMAKRFPDSTGRDIAKGDTVKLDGKVIGTAAYRVMDGKRKVPRIGVALAATKTAAAAATVNGRTVKNRCFDAADLTVVTKG